LEKNEGRIETPILPHPAHGSDGPGRLRRRGNAQEPSRPDRGEAAGWTTGAVRVRMRIIATCAHCPGPLFL